MRRLWRDPRDQDPDRPDWQALVDAIDHAADIASPPFIGGPRRHVIRDRVSAQIMADFWTASWLREEVDAELFALEAALATYPTDLFGREEAVKRYAYLTTRLPG